jgi:hypothetical protein
MHDPSLIGTDVTEPYALRAAEAARILNSLRRNGVAAIRGFVPPADVAEIHRAAETATSAGFTYGSANSLITRVTEAEGTRDFPHPFLLSAAATRVVTAGAVVELVEAFLGDRAMIHHGIFQRSLPREKTMLDWHIDCGSNKALNGTVKFSDLRLRSILYLSDVESGGLGYVLDSAPDALKTFLALPPGDFFPPEKVPTDRQVAMNQPAGTLILFNTHGLHRPELPKSERLVMNVWFARRDFAAQLPPALFSLALVPPENRDRLYVFENQRGAEALRVSAPAPRPGMARRLLRRIAR